ncbi:TPA: thermonuclease family protein [Pseudomonas aeruginosa]
MGAFFMSVVSAFAGAAEACRPTGALQNVEVARVVDGDTVRLRDGRSVRLIGINAPELAHNGRTTEPFAEAAKQRLQALVSASDGRLTLQPGRQARDHYGRTLAHLFDASGANLEARLLGEGLGYLVAVAPNTELTACQQAAERAARSANLGVWKRSPVLSLDRLAQSGFAVVRGRVLEVERNRGGIWLEMDGPLVLRIEPKVLKAFDAKRVMQMAGRSLEVRGWVVDRSRRGAVPAGKARWQMSVTDPAMLEWLP